MPCPFCELPRERVVLENEVALAVRDGFPVSPGHTLVLPRRHVASFFAASAAEREGLLALVEEVKARLDAELHPDGYNVGWNDGEAAGQTVMHLHLHVIPRYRDDLDDPRGGVRLVIPEAGNYKRPGHIPRRPARGREEGRARPLATGGREDPFLRHLQPLLQRAREIAILAAFVQGSGVDRLGPELAVALRRGARVRVLTGDYLNLTQARALRGLLDLSRGREAELAEPEPDLGPVGAARLELRVVELERLRREALGSTFHPKAWIFVEDEAGAAFVGSSNLSAAALGEGVEWNLRVERALDPVAFDAVLERYELWWGRGRPVDEAWLEGYSERARAVERELPTGELEPEPLAPLPPLWEVQEEALLALRRTRAEGRERALVVLATGLGKTVLAASDVACLAEELGHLPRVLFLAHRVELLRQAATTFRRRFPDARFGWYVGEQDGLEGDVVLASVAKLGRRGNLEAVAPRRFEYVIVDEVHHADARTYRRILAHLRPRFLLGLTATPERADAGDVLGLFDDNLAYRADLGRGIVDGHLAPFRYLGLADTIDYAPIPWRNRRFDPEALARAAQTEARMERLLRAWREHPGERTLVFCCSIAHAEHAARWLAARGVAVAAVHSGPGSAERDASLAALAAGELQALCTVDLLSEGVDLPSLDRVVMLRPTESPVVFLQQLGRGLRVDPARGEKALTVIDFVGNHRVFLDRVRTLLSLAPGGEATTVRELVDGAEPVLPPGCSVELELEAKDLMRAFLAEAAGDLLVRRYRELRDARGERPRLGELYRLGLNPRSLRQTTWFDLVRDEGDLGAGERVALEACGELLADVERREAMTRSFKMVALQALLEADALASGMTSRENAERSHAILHRSPELLAELPEEHRVLPSELARERFRRYWEEWPLGRWAGSDRKGRAHFRLEGGRFAPRFAVPEAGREALAAMLEELVDYRLAQYRARRREETAAATATGARAFVCKLIQTHGKPILKLPERERFPAIPTGETDVTLPDGRIWRFRFVKLYVNVTHPVGSASNQLPDLARRWFGLDAGQPGTDHRVRFTPGPDGWRAEPLPLEGAEILPFPERGFLRAYPSVRAAAGWGAEARLESAIEADAVRLPGPHDEGCFALRASGRSMEGLGRGIRDGDWLVLRLARGATLGAALGRVALIARGHPEEGRSFHVKRVARRERGFALESDNPDVPEVDARDDDELLALHVRTVRPESLAPERGAELAEDELAAAFALSASPSAPVGRVDGHLFLMIEGAGSLAAPDRVERAVPDRREAETAFVLGRAGGAKAWRYLGVGRWLEDEGRFAIENVDFATWRELGQGRMASRRIEEVWLVRARERVDALLAEPGPGGWVEADGRRCRIAGRAARSGIRIDGGPGGFEERTVSELDLAWVLRARALAATIGRVADEGLVNELRYLEGTPKESTRWIDTGWAIVLTAGSST
jgi:superfamily II DNA or RNA helicase/diadenosine tetraphosphate (Ap4A) HIT family hydrolase